eukprot:TRINITY_DN5325_c0_g1_i4.p1 TRINITY_DN5325_c0_g1~~TRINITY_DN5325_c0_g1_i4.p1  ORF type:complete len:446 (-),score=30.57 TRINITY_DN5325_c0_g1_i4:152-1489(-)
MYSGYVTVDPKNGRNLFYWFVPSSRQPASDPVVLWLQGGPGCSGLVGLLEEHGPYVPNEHGGLRANPYSWNRVANVLYIEAPSGVGFSYSDTPSDYNTDDTKTALDNYAFLRLWYEIYPEFKNNRLWITGESYGGVYVPTLTELILRGNDAPLRKRLEGIMVGNGVFSCGIDENSIQFNLFYWHGLISYTNYQNWTAKACDRDSSRPACDDIFNRAYSEIGVIDQQLANRLRPLKTRAVPKDDQPSLDPDDLYQDFCEGNGTLAFTDYDPFKCKQSLGRRTSAYLNRRDVKNALHARNRVWSSCSDEINYSSSGESMVPYYLKFFNANPPVSVLIYNGDVDIATVPFAYNQPCLAQFNRQNQKVWAPWFVNGATAGYVEYFDSYTFATVKGAGHEVPLYQPLSSFNMFSRFLSQGNLDDNSGTTRRHSVFARKQGSVLRSARIPQ